METPARDGALLHRNRQMQIQHWQERTSHEIEQQEQGVNSRLIQNCQDALQCLIRHLDTDLVSTREHNTLRRCLASLQLWSDGYGVTTGVLDNILDRSKSLRLTTLSILNPMCKALSQGLRTHVLSTKYKETAVSICSAASELCSQTEWLLVDHKDDISDSDNESSNSDDDAKNNIRDLVKRVRTYTDSLIDLSTALDCPALEPEPKDRPNLVTLEQRSAQDYHTDLIKCKFPQAEKHLLQSLGRTSWSRYQRMQQEREASMLAQSSCSKSQVAGSEFQDSGIGTSLPRDNSTYAETIISFMTSVSEGKRVNIPSLPAEAKEGLPFECTACARRVQITNNRDWRKHLYMDLRPYNCLFVSCSFTHEPFANRQLWVDHLELGHGYGPTWEAVHCPLCLDTTKSGKNAILVHFARHLEEIALTSLPRDVESDTESERTTATRASSDFSHEASPKSNLKGDPHVRIHEEAKELLGGDNSLRLPPSRILDAQSEPEDGNWTDNIGPDLEAMGTGEEAKASRSTENDVDDTTRICNTSEGDGRLFCTADDSCKTYFTGRYRKRNLRRHERLVHGK
ncbi:hypothetical protein C7974DRAFT_474316 [Boeremia exigua]|uniref:uncharacterized protein n=1 Tax=Boeremia exigua TaxID=749465 RepID=UPI001E8E7ADB|nr:uncharacterized protein C7974DRAFT_474316 [Boeremia exigua]KAH6618468.1 hypothetical protein C7974DRAFT_474316 [Boeremia exigua]